MWRILKNDFPKRFHGGFVVAEGLNALADLKLDAERTEVQLRSETPFRIDDAQASCLLGTLEDRTQVSLFDCLITKWNSPAWGSKQYTSAALYAHYALLGPTHIRPDEAVIRGISFVIDDAHAVFHDSQAFGSVFDAGDIIQQVLAADKRESAQTGAHPWVTYYTGRREITSVETCLGKVTIANNPSGNFGDASGVRIDNTISVNLDLPSPSRFADVLAGMWALLRYLDVLAGRPQNAAQISISLAKELDGHPVKLDVYCCAPPRREAAHEWREPHVADILLSPVRNAPTYARVLARWLEMDQARLAARQRFSQSFAQQRFYSIDRLVAAANMFDILPAEAVPAVTLLTPELVAAKKQARSLFAALPESIERDAMLNAIGRIGKSSLKTKIRHRADPVIEGLGRRFADLPRVTDHAVNCRNYYVHSDRKAFDYANNFDARMFFTNTLEFVFGASDLIDAGWDMKAWLQRHSGLSHPFAAYLREYERNLQTLLKLLERSNSSEA